MTEPYLEVVSGQYFSHFVCKGWQKSNEQNLIQNLKKEKKITVEMIIIIIITTTTIIIIIIIIINNNNIFIIVRITMLTVNILFTIILL